jgi:hypothetical protein
MIEQEAYDALTNAGAHWTRINERTIRVYMSSDGNGLHHEGLDKVTAFLEQAGFFEFDRDFDRMCFKGYCDYKVRRK